MRLTKMCTDAICTYPELSSIEMPFINRYWPISMHLRYAPNMQCIMCIIYAIYYDTMNFFITFIIAVAIIYIILQVMVQVV